MNKINWQFCNDPNEINEVLLKGGDYDWEGLTDANQIINIFYFEGHRNYMVFWATEALQNLSKPNNGLQDSDLVSRHDVIDAVNSLTYPSSVMDVKRKLIELPSAEPKTKCVAQIRIDRDDMEDLINEKVNEIVDKMAEPKTGWIPVSERLPEKETRYLCTFEEGTVSTSSWHKTTQHNNGFDNVMHCINMSDEHDNTIYSYGVTAWMPLPEPYREDGEA